MLHIYKYTYMFDRYISYFEVLKKEKDNKKINNACTTKNCFSMRFSDFKKMLILPNHTMSALCVDIETHAKTCFWRFLTILWYIFDGFFDHSLMILWRFFVLCFQKDVDSARKYKWEHCALTQEPLQKPVVACELVCHKKYLHN